VVSNVVFQCRSCGEELRTEPRSCPFCGAGEPTRGDRPLAGPAAIASVIAREREPESGRAGGMFSGIMARGGGDSGRREPRLGPSPAPRLGGVTKDDGSIAAAPQAAAAGAPAERAAAADLRLIRTADRPAESETRNEAGLDRPADDRTAAGGPQRASSGDTIVRVMPAGADDTGAATDGTRDVSAADAEDGGNDAAAADEVARGERPASPRARGGALVVASRRGRELAPVAAQQGISFVRRLIRITAMALIIIGIIGAGNWWMQNNNLGDLGLDPATTRSSNTAVVEAPAPANSETFVVEPGDAWTVVLPEGQAAGGALLRGSAPMRVRVDGEPFLVPADRSVRISATAAPVEVKATEAGTEVAVTRLGDGD
jgi:hypothetical protein